MDSDLGSVSFLRRDKAFNFAKVDDCYHEILNLHLNQMEINPRGRSATTESNTIERIEEEYDSENLFSAFGNECEPFLSHEIDNTPPFNFLCTIPYANGKQYDEALQKIHSTRVLGANASAATEYGPNLNSSSVFRESNINDDHTMSNTYSQDKVKTSVEKGNSSLAKAINTEDSEHSSHKTDAHYTRSDIPSAVRDMISYSIQEQRKGEESLESEQLRRLTEFTLWRRAIMQEATVTYQND